jgi:hypothetical protein
VFDIQIALFLPDEQQQQQQQQQQIFYLPTYKQLQKILTSLIFKSVEVLAS